MKRTELPRRIAATARRKGLAFMLVHHGANHDVYRVGTHTIVVARHNDVPECTARGTIQNVENL